MLIPKTNSQTYWQKEVSHVMNGIIFSICLILAFSALIAALGQCRKEHRKEQEKRGLWQSQSRRWTWPHLSRQVLRLCRIRLRRKAQDAQGTLSKWLVKYRETWEQENSIKTQRRVLKRGKKMQFESTRRLLATEEDQEHLNFPHDSISTRQFVASGNSETEDEDKNWPHNLHVSKDGVPHMEKVFSIVRQRYGLSPRDKMENLDVNAAIWGIFMSVTLQAAVHLGTDFTENLRSTRKQSKKSLRQLFQVTRKLITDQTEMTVILRLIGSSSGGEIIAKTCVFSDSVLCLGDISPEPVKAWESKIQMYYGITLFQRIESDRLGTDGIRVDNFPRIHEIENSRQDSKDDDGIKVWTRAIERKDHLHVNVLWHWIEKTRKQRKLYCECSQSDWICSKIHARTLVIFRAWIGKEMVRNSRMQTRWRMGRSCWEYDDQLYGKRTSKIPCIQRLGKRRIEKQRERNEIHSLQR